MNGYFFSYVTLSVLLITVFQWPKLKQKTKQEKATFIIMLLLVWGLSMLDLPHSPGPTTLISLVFKPFSELIGL
ncbi:hypothetical protein [Paenibacillus qinlingensis]|uniref:Na+/melibiose symporter-like transporter n=1 Tax=Paenibacillus qinlingensis TaxID=1837343 RepID=A0ABU1NWC7_9BACL|nr:hypothetical protein [Paenibacillus qinlingensis]MDR6551735.1 Na+/melibiose symporter-like transporter [Paenibacillus qinlingensis]